MIIADEQLHQLLSELDYLLPADLKKAESLATSEKIPLYEALVKSDLISDENLGKLVAYSLKLPFVSLGEVTIPEDILRLTPQHVVKARHLIAFASDEEKGLHIATSEPTQTEAFEMLAKKAGMPNYEIFYATDADLEDVLRLYRKELQATFEVLLATKVEGRSEPPVAKIVDTLIEYAYTSKASDVHIEPTRTTTLIRFRIDGVLHDAIRLPKALHTQIATRVKVLARLRTDEHYSAQDGRMHIITEADEALDIRVSIVPVVAGEKVVMRLLTSHFRQFSLTDLGMAERDLKKVNAGFRRPYGMVLSTGPTGSGKTTSMYAILKILNTREKNIATIEDPVEYEIAGINQIQANTKTNLTFANGLRSILRQDPDIIYVGEIRDAETADIAINSAMTGHLVLSTLHTNDSATTLPRLIDMGVEPFLVASTVNVIIAQRLVRKICVRCKVSAELVQTPTGWQGDTRLAAQFARLDPVLVKKSFGEGKNIRIYQGKGCPVCHQTGYVGRLGIFEVLDVGGKVQDLITRKANSDEIMRQAISEGMTTMQEDGVSKIQQGVTTVEEVLRVTTE